MGYTEGVGIRQDSGMPAATQTTQFDDVTLEGEGLSLRPFTEADLDAITEACADEETQRWLPLPRPYSRDDARWFVETFSVTQRDSGAGLVRAIEVEGRLAGAIDLKKTDWTARTTETGYWAAPWVRGRGVTTTAVRLLASWALTDQGFERVELLTAMGNTGSERVAEKAGFQREGIARNAGVIHEGRVDLTVWSLVPADLIPTPHETPAEPAHRG